MSSSIDNTVYWWPEGEKLVYVGRKADPMFWDQRWENKDWKKTITRSRQSRYWRKVLKRFLPEKGHKILEGGCGEGHLVDAMNYWGYDAVGIDFAANTIRKIHEVMPELDVRHGDVRQMELDDATFDGYLSGGVIEHFWEGYEAIISEMNRVLKVDGLAMVTFPSISPLDRLKIRLGGYKILKGSSEPDDFYQFCLDANEVQQDFKRFGFECLFNRRQIGLQGLDRLWRGFMPINRRLLAMSRSSKLGKVFYYGLSVLMAPLCGHTVLLVCRKTGGPNE